jgi:hypothetical protein
MSKKYAGENSIKTLIDVSKQDVDNKLQEHIDTLNPHNITKSTIGLDNVENYKAVSTEVQELTDEEKDNIRTNIGADDEYAKLSIYSDASINLGRKKETDAGDCSTAEGNNTTASGDYSHAEGADTIAGGEGSHAEGYMRNINDEILIYVEASGDYSHAEGSGTKASGKGSHAEGTLTKASGDYSHAEGGGHLDDGGSSAEDILYSEAKGKYSHSEGYSYASGDYSHTEGYDTSTIDPCSHAEGYRTEATGSCSHAEGAGCEYGKESGWVSASGDYSHAEGEGTTATGTASHAEGYKTTASGTYSHTEGNTTSATKDSTHAEGESTIASGLCSHAEGDTTVASGNSSHAEGGYTTASGPGSHAEGNSTTASGDYSHAEGFGKAKGNYSHAEGYGTQSIGGESHAEGYATKANGGVSHAEGWYTIAEDYQHAQGHYNDPELATGGTIKDTSGTAFVIGNGTSAGDSNAFRVDYDGATYAQAAYSATGADYAEYFEWLDGNPDNEDRRGKFVTLSEDKIVLAKEGDWVLGIVSANPCVLGNTDTEWQGKFMKDEFGAYIKEKTMQTIKVPQEIKDENGNTTIEEVDQEVEVEFYKVNPDYDLDKGYIQRDDRPEWSAIGMLGVLAVYDDGTCEVNGYCKCNDNSIATKSDSGYRVIKRVSDNIVKIVLK